MADNVDVTPGIGATIAADEVGGAKWQRVKLGIGADGTAVDMGTPADALSGGATLPAGAMVFNGSTWDRQRGNTEGTLLASAARTAQASSATQTNYNARGVILSMRVTAKSAATTLTINVFGVDPVGSQSYYFAASAAWAAAATNIYNLTIYPGVIHADLDTTGYLTTNKGVSAPLPRTWGAVVTPSDASSVTYSLGYQYVI